MANKATLYLVEACSNFDTDLQQAVMVANNLVACGITGIAPSTLVLTYPACTSPTGKGEVSMSWGGGEFAGENNPSDTSCSAPDDSCFTTANVVYVAAAGDSPGVIWPSTSPNVVAAGGLSTRRNPLTTSVPPVDFEGSGAWVFGGGGQSAVESQPSYQSSGNVQAVCGTTNRCTPDVAFDADPYTGVWVYDTFPIFGYEYYQWIPVGGTSLAAPAIAGMINHAGSFRASSKAELTNIYGYLGSPSQFKPITSGYCGPYMGFNTNTSTFWTFCAGVGSPYGYGGF
jgi:subtilase family serine protease